MKVLHRLLDGLALTAALLTIVWAPLYEGSTFGTGMMGLTVLGCVTALLTLASLLVRGSLPVRNPVWLIGALLLLGWVWASTTWAPYPLEAQRWAGVWTAVIGTAVSLHLLCSTAARRGVVTVTMLLTGAAAVVIALLQQRGITVPGAQTMPGVPDKYLTGPYFHPSHYSGYLIPVAALASSAVLFVRPRGWLTPLWVLPLAALQVGVQYTNLQTDGSSIPAVMLAGALPLLVWIWRKRWWAGLTLTLALAGGVLYGAYLFVTPAGQQTFNDYKARIGIRSQNFENFLAVRRDIHSFGHAMWDAHPVQGAGVGQFVTEFQQYRKPARPAGQNVQQLFVNYAHSDYFQMLSELGTVGLGLYLLVLFGSVLVRRPGLGNLAWFSALPVLLFTGLYDSHLTAIPGTMLTAFALSALPGRTRPRSLAQVPDAAQHAAQGQGVALPPRIDLTL